MAPKGKGENTKKVAGNAKKAEIAAQKKAVEDSKKEQVESQKWQTGAKDNSKAYAFVSISHSADLIWLICLQRRSRGKGSRSSTQESREGRTTKRRRGISAREGWWRQESTRQEVQRPRPLRPRWTLIKERTQRPQRFRRRQRHRCPLSRLRYRQQQDRPTPRAAVQGGICSFRGEAAGGDEG